MRTQILQTDRGTRLIAQVAETRRERSKGLLGRATLEPSSALLLERTRSVHTIGMRFHLAIAFLDEGFRVLEVVRGRPGILFLPRRRARHVLEAHPNVDLRPGDQVRPAP